MNTQVGKSIGIALLLAAGLLAALFAMGVFSATGVSADKDDEGNETHSVLTDLSFEGKDSDGVVVADAKIKESFSNQTHDYTAEVSAEVKTVSVGAKANTDSTVTITPSGDIDVTGTYETEFKIVVSGDTNAGDVKLPDGTYTVTVQGGRLATTKTTPSSNQSLEVRDGTGSAWDENIIVELASFGVPSSIDTDDVKVVFTKDITEAVVKPVSTGNPSDIEIDGTTVTLVAPFLVASGADKGNEIGVGDGKSTAAGAKITFRRGAGITLPIRHGDYDIEVTNDEEDEDGVQNWVTVRREVSVSPKSGKRGTEITVSGKGFADGSANVVIGDIAFTTATVADGAFSIKVDTADKINDVNVFVGKTKINASDAVGGEAATDATFEIKPSFTVTPENPLSGADITITLVDTETKTKPTVTFAGNLDSEAVTDAGDDKDTTWKATVPAGVRIGTIQVKVSFGETNLTQNITIGTNDLTITPATVVPRQEISIDGTGFTKDEKESGDKRNTVAANSVEFGTTPSTHAEQLVNNTGNISFNINVPDSVKPGTVKVTVKDVAGRVGTAEITVAKPAVTLDPAESLIGFEITVSGTGFPANDLVLIKYDGNTVDTADTSSIGEFSQTITVPSGNDPGTTSDVTAVAQVQEVGVDDKASASAKHKLPNAVITLSPTTAAAGSSLTINGTNFKGFLSVFKIEVGGQNVTPVPAPATDKWGVFSTTVRIPQLTPARYAVKVIVEAADGDSATEFLQIDSEAPVVTEPVVMPELSVAPAEAMAGAMVTISGANLPANQLVLLVTIGGEPVVTSSDNLLIGADGTFSQEVAVPEVEAGMQAVVAVGGGQQVSSELTVVAPVITAPAELFAELGARLLRVWEFDNATQAWSFYDPRPDRADFNSLTEMSSGDIATIIISSGDPIEFQGSNLYSGTNQIVLK